MTRPGRKRQRTAVVVSGLLMIGAAAVSASTTGTALAASSKPYGGSLSAAKPVMAVATPAYKSTTPAATAKHRLMASPPTGMPIKHVVVIFQENHTFDQLLGGMCASQGHRCDGATTGLAGTSVIPLSPAPDIVPAVDHSVAGQAKAVNGGLMDGFYKLTGCTAPGYACYTQATQASIPTLWNLATNYGVSDRTFSMLGHMSWEQHMELGSLTADGFSGNNPTPDPALSGVKANGWSCASADHVKWTPVGSTIAQFVQPCVPTAAGTTQRGATPVPYVPDFYDNVLVPNNISYNLYGHLYASGTAESIWSTGAMFATWEFGSQRALTGKRPGDILTDIKNGTLPQVSIVTPLPSNSQHNNDSLIQGDNWIGSVVSAIQASPYWASTAIEIVYDDCGCFYDHVVPPAGAGMRTPFVIVSPWVKPGFVDHTTTTFAPANLAFMEWVFGLTTLTATSPDNGAYHWQDMFDFNQVPLGTIAIKATPIPASSQKYLASHPISQTADPDS